MNRYFFQYCLAIVITFLGFACREPKIKIDKTMERKIDSLLVKMTLEEKIGQTAQRGESSLGNGELPDELKKGCKDGPDRFIPECNRS